MKVITENSIHTYTSCTSIQNFSAVGIASSAFLEPLRKFMVAIKGSDTLAFLILFFLVFGLWYWIFGFGFVFHIF